MRVSVAYLWCNDGFLIDYSFADSRFACRFTWLFLWTFTLDIRFGHSLWNPKLDVPLENRLAVRRIVANKILTVPNMLADYGERSAIRQIFSLSLSKHFHNEIKQFHLSSRARLTMTANF